MKARIKTTGEYVDVKPNGHRHVLSQFYKAEDGRDIPATCLEFEKEIDWEARRFELFKAVSSGIMANIEHYKAVRELTPYVRDESNKEKELTTYEVMAAEVRKFSDAVLAEYRKGEKQ